VPRPAHELPVPSKNAIGEIYPRKQNMPVFAFDYPTRGMAGANLYEPDQNWTNGRLVSAIGGKFSVTNHNPCGSVIISLTMSWPAAVTQYLSLAAMMIETASHGNSNGISTCDMRQAEESQPPRPWFSAYDHDTLLADPAWKRHPFDRS
jgi:hypothetical protein